MLTQTAEMAVLSKAAPPLLSDAACPGLPSHSVTKHSRGPSSQHRASLLVGNFHDTLTAAQRVLRKGKRPTLHTQVTGNIRQPSSRKLVDTRRSQVLMLHARTVGLALPCDSQVLLGVVLKKGM